jgi:hypothetical protein
MPEETPNGHIGAATPGARMPDFLRILFQLSGHIVCENRRQRSSLYELETH